jgi:poly(A) polymerase
MTCQTTHISKPWMSEKKVTQVFTALDNQARFVGGCVRNTLLDIPITDIDIATPLAPEAVMKLLEQANIQTIPTGIKHGTVTAIIEHTPFEITTLRKDIACHGRHATVEFTDKWEEDAARRDFTINAMSCDPHGTIYDYFSGLEDIKRPVIRFVGDAKQRCREDYLRILRFFRFTALYGKEFHTEGLAAATELAPHIEELSGERIQQEMKKLLAAADPVWVLEAMCDSPVWLEVMAESLHLDSLKNYLANERRYHLPIDPVIRLAALVRTSYDPKEEARIIAARWKLSNDDRRRLILLADCTFPADDAAIKEIIRNLGNVLATFAAALSYPTLSVGLDTIINDTQHWQAPHFPLTGKDLMDAGYAPGKQMGMLLKQAEVYWAEHDYTPDKAALIAYVKGL